MKTITTLLVATATLGLATACKKEVETMTVPTDKAYSWAEVKQLYGAQRFILGMSKDANSLYLQQPSWLGVLTPAPSAPAHSLMGYGYYGASVSPISTLVLPSDVQTRMPLGPDFFAYPYHEGDSVLIAFSTAPPLFQNQGAEIHLHRLDPRATTFALNKSYIPFKFGAINSTNYLLVNYKTNIFPDPSLHFTLSKVSVPFGGVTAETRLVSVPLPSPSTYAGLTTVAAVDDYFLANALNQGIYKIKSDGTARQVFGAAAVVDYYKWQGVVYAVEGNSSNAVITSADNGETWQRQTGVPSYFGVSTFRPVGDSLVGITHTIATNSLYSLRWNGGRYRVRELKRDGLGQADFTDIVQLGDTVYLGTTSGLFKRPLSTFFEPKPKP